MAEITVNNTGKDLVISMNENGLSKSLSIPLQSGKPLLKALQNELGVSPASIDRRTIQHLEAKSLRVKVLQTGLNQTTGEFALYLTVESENNVLRTLDLFFDKGDREHLLKELTY